MWSASSKYSVTDTDQLRFWANRQIELWFLSPSRICFYFCVCVVFFWPITCPHAAVGHSSFVFSSNQKLPISASRRWSVQTLHDWPVLSSLPSSTPPFIHVTSILLSPDLSLRRFLLFLSGFSFVAAFLLLVSDWLQSHQLTETESSRIEFNYVF